MERKDSISVSILLILIVFGILAYIGLYGLMDDQNRDKIVAMFTAVCFNHWMLLIVTNRRWNSNVPLWSGLILSFTISTVIYPYFWGIAWLFPLNFLMSIACSNIVLYSAGIPTLPTLPILPNKSTLDVYKLLYPDPEKIEHREAEQKGT